MAHSVIEHEFQPDLTGPADPYRRLGVSRDASKDDIKRAFRKLAQKYHPDKGGDESIFGELRLCYDTLMDDKRRADYDATGTLKEKTPDNSESDAVGALIMALERAIGALIQTKTEPRHVDMVARIATMLDAMEGEFHKEEAQIKDSLPEWESIVKRFKVKKGNNVFATYITTKIGEMRLRQSTIERQKKGVRLAKKMVMDYSFDWERPEPFISTSSAFAGTSFIRMTVG